MIRLLNLILCVLSKKFIAMSKIEENGYITENTILIGDMRYDLIESSEYLLGEGIEEDGSVEVDGYKLQNDPIWNLDRIDQRGNEVNSMYFYNDLAGSGVWNYVLDTGVDIKHPEFEGRAYWGINTADNETQDGCMHRHGTHVAGTIGSKTYGVAKNTSIVSVKVLDCSGSGSTSNILKALEWVAKQDKKKKVINMSLGGSFSNALNSAVEQISNLGIIVVVAAGNENSNACHGSPSSSSSAITVGATNKQTEIAYFSNWGTCVDIFAPGTDIKSTIPGGKTEFLQGTSMAAPHISGIVSLILDGYSGEIHSQMVKSFIKFSSTKNKVSGDLKNSPNYFGFSLSSFALY
jgi:subtilisin family serine protease